MADNEIHHPPMSRKQRFAIFYSLAVLFLTTIGVMLSNVWYTNSQVMEAERTAIRHSQDDQRKICGIIVVLDDAYRQTPPQTATGKELAEKMAKYRRDLGCEPAPSPSPSPPKPSR